MYHWIDENGDLAETHTLSGYSEPPARIPGDVAVELIEDRQRRIRERLDELAEHVPPTSTATEKGQPMAEMLIAVRSGFCRGCRRAGRDHRWPVPGLPRSAEPLRRVRRVLRAWRFCARHRLRPRRDPSYRSRSPASITTSYASPLSYCPLVDTGLRRRRLVSGKRPAAGFTARAAESRMHTTSKANH